MSDHPVYTGYAIFTPKDGYVSIFRSGWNNQPCYVYVPCRDQMNPFIFTDFSTAERMKAWMEKHFPESHPVIIPRQYSNGAWL